MRLFVDQVLDPLEVAERGNSFLKNEGKKFVMTKGESIDMVPPADASANIIPLASSMEYNDIVLLLGNEGGAEENGGKIEFAVSWDAVITEAPNIREDISTATAILAAGGVAGLSAAAVSAVISSAISISSAGGESVTYDGDDGAFLAARALIASVSKNSALPRVDLPDIVTFGTGFIVIM
jgi:hypothetical protein